MVILDVEVFHGKVKTSLQASDGFSLEIAFLEKVGGILFSENLCLITNENL
jgi:hypothetical protein